MSTRAHAWLLLACGIATATSLPQVSAQTAAGLPGVQPARPPVAEPLPIGDVRLLDGPFREAQRRDLEVLLRIDPDRLLHMFRVTAGLPSSATPLGGWEAPQIELRGHTLGHYLTALALMHAATGDSALKTRGDAIVTALAACQDALPRQGARPGYLSAFPESFIDRVVAREPVWAPWYTLHKIMAGLLDWHVLTGNAQALQVVTRMADWVRVRIDALSPAQLQAMLDTEFGGMNDVFAELHVVTGNPDHLRLARAFDHKAVFDPLAKGEDRLDGLHANTQVPKAIGAARLWELTGEPRYRDVARTFWERVALHRSYAIGGHSDIEHFFPPHRFAQHLSPETAETCNTYNMLKLTRRLFGWAPSAELMDFYERGLVNHILASQDPRQGMFVYLTSLAPGHFKTYSTLENSFWCCVGTGMENHAKYGDTVYYAGAGGLYVNLFVASEARWRARGVTLRQETGFPESDRSRLTIAADAPARWTLHLRWPGWAPRFTVAVNGSPVTVSGTPGSYVPIDRTWNAGDVVEIAAPFTLRVEPLPGEPTYAAIMYGPVVLAGELGTDGLAQVNAYAKDQTDNVRVPAMAPPVLVADGDPLAHIHPVAGEPLTFETRGLGRPRDVRLAPFYRTHHQRYTVYWRVFTPTTFARHQRDEAAAEAQRQARERRIVDRVEPGPSGNEQAHGLAGDRVTTGQFFERHWRSTQPGGWFSWTMRVPAGRASALSCRYWGGEQRPRTFDIEIDGQRVATQALHLDLAGEFVEREHAIPGGASDRAQVTVTFRGREGSPAGPVYGCAVLAEP